ncbi:MAG TPA: YgjV family protein [Propionibacterium sp.]|nr:YgjV family protein [Propionibacterium sp.]
MNWVEVVGYVASALVAASFMMKSLVKLRWVSLVGSVIFVVYAILIGAWPVVITNTVVAVANIVHLRKELGSASTITAVPMRPESPFLQDYLGANADDIATSQPAYHPSPLDTFVRLVSREGLPAGVLVGEPAGRELLIKLDYVTPAYRDSVTAKWLFGPGRTTFTDAGFTRLIAHAHTAVHRGYLELVGFRPEGNAYVLDLA